MKQATLCLLIRENGEENDKEILLAMKKKGFGIGKWNGVGGKFDSRKGDRNVIEAAIREAEEEIGIKINNLEKVAILDFYFPHIPQDQNWNQQVHVFITKDWIGEPQESEEMKPKWFKVNEIPFDKMWTDDIFWLPKILSGRKLKAKFVFSKEEIILQHEIKILKKAELRSLWG